MKRAIVLMLSIGLLLAGGTVDAQVTGAVKGRISHQNQPLTGVTVTASSSSLQGGTMSVVTGSTGDYKLPFLPPGEYQLTFALESFYTLEQTVTVTASQTKIIDTKMVSDMVTEEIDVYADYETISTGAGAAGTIEHDVLEQLPVERDLISAVGLAAGTSNTGPGGVVTISGAMSFESLFTLNGVVLNENLRGQPHRMYIEDAIEQTTVMTSGLSAEYGRFSGGVVNLLSRSGGNQMSGSYRLSLSNDDWIGRTPLTTVQTDDLNQVHEATLGGALWQDRLWFFLAGRDMDETTSEQTFLSNLPYTAGIEETRFEAKLTLSPSTGHRVVATYTDIEYDKINQIFLPAMDLQSIDPLSGEPVTGFALSYTGVLSDRFFVEVLYSERSHAFTDNGGDNTELELGTPIIDYYYGTAATSHAPFLCAVCTTEERDNDNMLLKGSYFLASDSAGTHDIVFGYDRFSDIWNANNWQSASGWLLGNFNLPIFDGEDAIAMFDTNGGSIIWGSVLDGTKGAEFDTISWFVNDTWRVNDHWSLGLGLRYDQNDGRNSNGTKSVDDSRLSPRLSASWDVLGDGEWIINASASRYVSTISYNQGNSGSAAGLPTWVEYTYTGPPVNVGCVPGDPDHPCLSNSEVISQVFDWFFNVYGGLNNPENLSSAYIPGVTPMISDSLASPYVDELSLGVTKRLGHRGMLRVDYVRRDYGDFYTTETSPATGQVWNEYTGWVDLGITRNEDQLLERKYDALMTRFSYRINDRLNLGGTWTWSHARGNFEGEGLDSGSLSSEITSYSEYKEVSWNMPSGDLNIDQRHKLRLWGLWDIVSTPRHHLSFSLLQSYFSGTPYSAMSTQLMSWPYVDSSNLGYVGYPYFVNYYFSDKGAYNWDDITSTDIALNYSFFVDLGGTRLELYLQPEILNLFNESGVVSGDSSAFVLADFNPFTVEPQEGVDWTRSATFGQPLAESDYQTPRTFRISLGVRF